MIIIRFARPIVYLISWRMPATPYERAVALFLAGKHEQALPGLAARVKAAPEDCGAMMYLGEALIRLNLLEQAGTMFAAVSQARPRDSMALAYLSQVKRRLGKTESGLVDLAKAIALDRSRVWMSSLGYGRESNLPFYARERDNLKEAIVRRLDWGLAHIALGLAEAHTNAASLGDIRARFERGLALDPGLTWSRAWLAEICRAAKEHGEAVKLLDLWLKESPEDADALVRRGESKAVTGSLASAMKDFDKAVKLRPESGSIVAWRGLVRLWTGDYKGALADCTRAVEAPQPFLWARGWRGAALLLLGKKKEAESELDAAIAEDPADAEAWVWRGELKRRSGRVKEAVKDLKEALSRRELLGARLNLAVLDGKELAAARALGPVLFEKAGGDPEKALALSLGNRTVLPTFKSGVRLLRA